MDNGHPPVRKLATDLIQSRDPRKEIGLVAWGRLLESQHGLDLASAALRKHFNARELTPEWFRDRLITGRPEAFDLIQRLLLQTHPAESLGAGYFVQIIKAADAEHDRALEAGGAPWAASAGSHRVVRHGSARAV